MKVITKFKNKRGESVPKTSAHSKVQVTFQRVSNAGSNRMADGTQQTLARKSPEEEHPPSTSG